MEMCYRCCCARKTTVKCPFLDWRERKRPLFREVTNDMTWRCPLLVPRHTHTHTHDVASFFQESKTSTIHPHGGGIDADAGDFLGRRFGCPYVVLLVL